MTDTHAALHAQIISALKAMMADFEAELDWVDTNLRGVVFEEYTGDGLRYLHRAACIASRGLLKKLVDDMEKQGPDSLLTLTAQIGFNLQGCFGALQILENPDALPIKDADIPPRPTPASLGEAGEALHALLHDPMIEARMTGRAS